jgi:hypothetical protein
MVSTARRAPNLHRSSPAGPSAGGKGDTRPHVVVGHPPSGDCWESPLGAWRTDDSEPATHATGPSPRTGSLTPTPGADTDADDEARIRTLIERWAQAVHAGDLDGVLADHATDIVMFDVPPPNGGVRGIDAYRATWPPFFDWQRQGAVFEIVDLDVTAGDDVRSPTPCFVAARPPTWRRTRATAFDSPSVYARRVAAGSSRTSTTRSPRRELDSRWRAKPWRLQRVGSDPGR